MKQILLITTLFFVFQQIIGNDENNNNVEILRTSRQVASLQTLALYKTCQIFADKYAVPKEKLKEFNIFLHNKILRYLESIKNNSEAKYRDFNAFIERHPSSDFKGISYPNIDWQALELFKEQRAIFVANAGMSLCAISMYEDFDCRQIMSRIKVYPLPLFTASPIALDRLKPSTDIQLPLITEWYHCNEHLVTIHQLDDIFSRFHASYLNLNTGTRFKTKILSGHCERPFIIDSRYLLLYTLDPTEGVAVFDLNTHKESNKNFSSILHHLRPLPSNSVKVFSYDYPDFESTILDFPSKKLIYYNFVFSLYDEAEVTDKSLILLQANKKLYYFVSSCGTLFYSLESDTPDKTIHWIKLRSGEEGKVKITTNLNINDLGLVSMEHAIKKYFK